MTRLVLAGKERFLFTTCKWFLRPFPMEWCKWLSITLFDTVALLHTERGIVGIVDGWEYRQ